MIRLGVIDTGLCNRRSMLNALATVGAMAEVIVRPQDLSDVDAVVLPGVGAFGPAMQRLRETAMDAALRDYARTDDGVILGVCLGMQLLADVSHEGGTFDGLALLPGTVRKLRPVDASHRVPNIGWIDVAVRGSCETLFGAPAKNEAFYFAHSFELACSEDRHVAATIEWDAPVCAAIECGNIFGVQFHPEKSQRAGLDLLERFVSFVADRRGVMVA